LKNNSGSTTSNRVAIYGIRKLGRKQYSYIGSTTQRPEIRLRRHLMDAFAKRHCNKKLARVIVESQGLLTIDVFEMVDKDQRAKREFHWIKRFFRMGHRLTNITNPINPRQKINWEELKDGNARKS
jgi:hypothetical protein